MNPDRWATVCVMCDVITCDRLTFRSPFVSELADIQTNKKEKKESQFQGINNLPPGSFWEENYLFSGGLQMQNLQAARWLVQGRGRDGEGVRHVVDDRVVVIVLLWTSVVIGRSL